MAKCVLFTHKFNKIEGILLAVSYDVESLFTRIPVKETLKYFLQKIYVDKSITPFCKNVYFQNIISKINKRMHFFCEFPFKKAN